jgi:chromosome segregation ATPase
MNNELNATKKDLLLVEELILRIKSKKDALVKRKINLQNSLSDLKDKYKGVEYKGDKFNEIKNTRDNLKEQFNRIELEIKSLNEELLFKNKLKAEIEFHLKHNKQIEGREDLDKIIDKVGKLKVKYSNFTKDRTRIASLRIMASEFIGELESLLK